MSVEKKEVVSQVSESFETEKKLGNLETSVKYETSRSAREDLGKKVERSLEIKTNKEVQRLTDQLGSEPETVPRPAPEQAKPEPNFLQRTWKAVISGPKQVVASFQEDPAKASVQTGAGIGLAAGAAYLTSGVAIAGSTLVAPIAAGAAGLAAGIWAAGKGIDAVRSRWNKDESVS